MSLDEQEFLRKLRATFKVEAEEHVQAISAGLLRLEKAENTDVRADCLANTFRHAHSLKGAARAVNLPDIEAICQGLEDVLGSWKSQDNSAPAEALDTLHRSVDKIRQLVLAANMVDLSETELGVSSITEQLRGLALTPRDELSPSAPSFSATQNQHDLHRVGGSRENSESRLVGDTIRVSTAKLDRLLLEAEEILTVKQTSAQRATELRQMEDLFNQWNTQWLKIQSHRSRPANESTPTNASSLTAVTEFLDWNLGFIKSLEAKIQALSKSTAEDRRVVAKLAEGMLTDSKQLLMLPFSTVAELFPRLVRDISREQGKEADLIIRGAEVELDKRILEELKDPLIHLLRNSVDHGVERPETRQGLNKPARATIVVSLSAVSGNKVELLVSDDGAGIDPQLVKKSAVTRRIISADEAEALSDEKALDLVFRVDVSTSSIISEISGRGLGLSIVHEKVEKLGGFVVLESTRNVGTTFRIVLPLTLATFRGIAARVAQQVFVIPTFNVERVVRIHRDEVRTVENRETIRLDDSAMALVRMVDVLEMANDVRERKNSQIVAIILGSGKERIAFEVDETLHEEEVLVKGLAKPLSRVRNIAAATVLASGDVVLILNATDLLKSARKAGRSTQSAKAVMDLPTESKAKKILLAEDSITSRMLLKGILESAGFQVKTAVDGVDALTILRTEDFDVVISDIEMPRMNGFDLTTHIRSEKRLAEKPVVLVTALASNEDRERGIDVGANAYIVKSSFDQSNLLEVIRRLA